MSNEVEIARLKILLDNASARLDKSIADVNQSQIDVATGRTAYFDRLTIGAGAVIAAIVSFLGSHASGLHPAWLLRCSLISLATAMICGLYRSYRYPYYIMQVRKAEWIEAALRHQRFKFQHLLAIGPSIDVHTGKIVDKTKVAVEQKTSFADDEAVITESNTKRDRLLKECYVAEGFCFVAIGVAMVSLVWLALRNF